MSRRIVVRRIECIAEKAQSQLKKESEFHIHLLALDGSCDIRDTEQLLIFIRGINNTFELTEELASVQSMKDSITGEDLLIEVEECVSNLDLDWGKLVNVTTDGCPSFTGKNKGLLKKKDKVNKINNDKNIIFCIASYIMKLFAEKF